MAMQITTFRLQVLSLIRMLFEGEVGSVYLSGDEGEFELLPFHYPILSALPEGEIKIENENPIPLRTGVMMFQDNQCIIIIEEMDEIKAQAEEKAKDDGKPSHGGSSQKK